MLCVRIHQISLHFVVHNILTKYINNNSVLARVFLFSLSSRQGVVSFSVSFGKENWLWSIYAESQIELYLFSTLQLPHVFVNCMECFTSRLLLEEILIQLQRYSEAEQTSHVPCDTLNDFVRLFKQAVASRELQDQTLYIVSNFIVISSFILVKREWIIVINNLCVYYK